MEMSIFCFFVFKTMKTILLNSTDAHIAEWHIYHRPTMEIAHKWMSSKNVIKWLKSMAHLNMLNGMKSWICVLHEYLMIRHLFACLFRWAYFNCCFVLFLLESLLSWALLLMNWICSTKIRSKEFPWNLFMAFNRVLNHIEWFGYLEARQRSTIANRFAIWNKFFNRFERPYSFHPNNQSSLYFI